jgi:small subunit ribosomal protein S6
MATEAPLYDLMLLLSLGVDDGRRAKILADTESAITGAGGTVERDDDWGRRPMAYEIAHQPEAEYHLLQFKAPGSLIEDLSHTLGITDGVLRFRVIKNRPGTPAAPSSPPPVVATAPTSSHAGPGAGQAPARESQAPGREEQEAAEPASSAATAEPGPQDATDS